MATYVSHSAHAIFDPSATGVVVTTPAGLANGDTIFFAIVMDNAQTGTFSPPGGVTQVGSWVTGISDGFGTPATGMFRVTYDGVAANYSFSFIAGASRGGSMLGYGYSGDCTHQQTVTGTNGSSAAARNSPVLTGTSGNTVLAFHGGSAAAVTLTWSGGFTELADEEWYGLNGAGDSPSGASVQATVTPSGGSTQSMWILEEIGPNAPAGGNVVAWIRA